MHQIVIDISRPQTGQLFFKIFVQRRTAADHELRQLCRDIDLLPDVAALEDLSEGSLAPRIDVSGVKIVHAGFISRHDLFLRFVYVNSVPFSRKAHAAVSQNRKPISVLIVPVLHHFSPFFFFFSKMG